MRSSQDARFVEELRGEKKQIFAELAPAEKVNLFKEAALKSVRDGYDAPLLEHKTMLENATPEDMNAYHAAFQNIIFNTSPHNSKEMAEMASIYSLMPQEARQTYLKTNQQDQKAVNQILTIQSAALAKNDATTVSLIERDFKNAGMMAQYTQGKSAGGTTATAPQPATQRSQQQRQQTPQDIRRAPTAGPIESRARGGGVQLNQEALKQARRQSGGGGEVSISPAVKKVMGQPPAKAAIEYAMLNPQEAKEVIQTRPDLMIAMRDEAPVEAQARIINDIKSSEPARRFGSAQGTQGRANTILGMPPQDQKMVLEAVADNPLQLTQLRSAVQQLPQGQQKQFYDNVLAEASGAARQQYAQHISAEKERAARDNRAGDVERLTREEQVITSKKPLVRQETQAPQQAQVDAIKPNGKKPAAPPKAPQLGGQATPQAPLETGSLTGQAAQVGGQVAPSAPPPPPPQKPAPPAGGGLAGQATQSFAAGQATTQVSMKGKLLESTDAVAPGETSAPAEGVPVSAMEMFKEKLRKARSKEDFEIMLKEVNAYLEGLRLLRQKQLEQGLSETSFEVQNTNRLTTEAELLIEEIKKQLAKFSS